MRVEIRRAHGGIQKPHTFIIQLLRQSQRFRQIHLADILLVHAPSIWVLDAIIQIQPRAQQKIRSAGFPDSIRQVKQKARAAFIRFAISAKPRVCREQFRHEVPVAGLDVHPVEPGALGQQGGSHIMLSQLHERVIRDRLRGIVHLAAFIQKGVPAGDHRNGPAFRLAETA